MIVYVAIDNSMSDRSNKFADDVDSLPGFGFSQGVATSRRVPFLCHTL